MLEGHKNVSAEEEKSKVLKKREEMYQIFKKKYILDDQGQLRSGVAKKKLEGGNEYIGQFDLDGKRSGKGIMYCKNGDKYFGDWKMNAMDG